MKHPEEKNEIGILKEVQRGKYREQYLIYNRKSTDEPDNQKNSITYQRSENSRFALREHLPVASLTIPGFCMDGIISEKHSGFKEDFTLDFAQDGSVKYNIDRPKFYRLLSYLNKGLFKGVIVLCWDRLSRNKGDDTIVRKLMRTGVDIRFVMAKYDKTSSGALHMDIDGMFAEHHSRVTSEKVSLNIRNLREKGICTYRAPVGYLNLGKMEDKPFDPERAPLIKRMFDLYATGQWSLADLARFAKDNGFTMTPMRRRRTETEMLAEETDDDALLIEKTSRPPTYNNIHKILTNPFYIGKVLDADGVYGIESISHKPLVSEAVFAQVQNVLKKKKVSLHYTKNLDYPYRGLVRCASCERVYTPYEKKGILYFAVNCKDDCPNQNKNFNSDYLETKVGALIEGFHLTEEELIKIDAQAGTDLALFEEKRYKKLSDIERKKKRIREELSYLKDNKLALLKSGVYTPESYIAEERNLTTNLDLLKDEEDISDIALAEVVKDIRKLSELLKLLYPAYENAIREEKEEIMRKLFSELSLNGDTLLCKCRNGLQAFESRFIPVCDPTTALFELIKHRKQIALAIEILETIVGTKKYKRKE